MRLSITPRRLRGRRLRDCTRGIAALEFVFLAPALLMLAFGVVVYSLYFTALLGVRQAAAEGARAAVAGLSTTERVQLAQTRATAVLTGYSSFLTGSTPTVAAAADSTGVLRVTVSYDLKNSPIMQYGSFIPLPNSLIQASVFVTNGGY